MTKEDLEIEKLQRELYLLKQPFWKQPAYLTIFATVLIGAISFVSTQKTAQKKELDELKLQKQELREETLKWKAEDNRRNLERYQEVSKEADRIIFEEYSKGFVDGVIKSPRGQERIREIVASPSPEAIEDLVQRVAYGALDAASKKRVEKLKELLEE